MSAASANRLTFDDALFATMRRALGVPVASQTVWRFDSALDAAAVERLQHHLAHGPLNRVAVRSAVPGARDRWVRGSVTRPLEVAPQPLAEDEVMGWVEAHAATDLDPEHGPTWSLALARTTAGGSVLSFVTSHVVADGSLKLLALDAAGRGMQLARLPDDDLPDLQVRLRDDLADAAGQVAGAARGLAGAALRRSRPAPPPRPTPTVEPGEPSPPVVVVCDVPAQEWERVAGDGAGSANSLLVAACVESLLAAGWATPGDTVPVAMPVSTRREGDLRSNASTGVSVRVETAADGTVPSLADVRTASKAAFAALADGGRHDPLALARALLPLVPDALVRRLAPTWPVPLVLASNLGRVSPAVEAPCGVPASAVLNRAITQAPARAGLSAWWGRTETTATLCVAAPYGSAAALRTLVDGVLTRRGLTPSWW